MESSIIQVNPVKHAQDYLVMKKFTMNLWRNLLKKRKGLKLETLLIRKHIWAPLSLKSMKRLSIAMLNWQLKRVEKFFMEEKDQKVANLKKDTGIYRRLSGM